MKCKDCQYHKEDGCDLEPSEMEDTLCFLRHIAIMLNSVYGMLKKDDDDRDKGDYWKRS